MQTSRAAQVAPLSVPEVLSIVSGVAVCLRPGFWLEVKVFENGDLVAQKLMAGMAKRPTPSLTPLEWEPDTDLTRCGPLPGVGNWR